MARDLAMLLDVVDAHEVDLVGYSMGAIVSLIYASGGARVRRLVVGGVGSGVIECGGVDRRAVSTESIIEALSADDASSLAPDGAAAFRRLADALGADREALIAQASSIYRGNDRVGADLGADTRYWPATSTHSRCDRRFSRTPFRTRRFESSRGTTWRLSPTRPSRDRSSISWPERSGSGLN